MSGFALTPDQARAVETAGVDLAVMAGAGSGKTRVLVERTVHLVTDEGIPLRKILAITFTEKAAREMKERLAGALTGEARAEVEWAYVSTIHGFCARLLRENALEAGVDPAFEVLDEVSSTTMLAAAVREAGVRFRAEAPGEAVHFDRLALADPGASLLVLLRELRACDTAPADLEFPEPDGPALPGAIREVLASLDDLEVEAGDAPPKSVEKAERVLERRAAVEAALSSGPDVALAALASLKGVINLSVSKSMKEILKPLKGETIPRALGLAADLVAAPALAALRELLGRIDRDYARRKDETGVLDFADLELRALRLLREREGIREAVRARFEEILVDEYQDVNPVQEAILALIRTPGRHFAVGDVKQAIYGFRHADPRLFRDYGRGVPVAGRVFLADNFRSSPALVDFSNRCFSRLFADQDLVDWTDMVAPSDGAKEDGAGVEVVLAQGENAREARCAEATAIAARIREMVAEEGFRYGDVALLFRALPDVKIYERALEDAGVPYYVVKGGGFFQAREIVDLVCLLRTVRNPRDEIVLAAALRSPFAALSEDALAALVTEARRREELLGDLLEGDAYLDGLGEGDAARWLAFRERFRRLRTLAARGSLGEVVRTAVDRSEIGTAVWLLSGGHRRAANFEKAAALAESLEGRFGFEEFLDVLEEYRAREVRETEAPTGGEHEDVVRLLTVHGAKGLEFPVVFVPDLTRTSGGGAPELLPGGRSVAAKVRRPDDDGAVETSAFAARKEERKAREAEESVRVLYVAVTRAERHLVLSAPLTNRKPSAGSWYSLLEGVTDLSGDAEDGPRVVRVEPTEEAGPRRASLATRHLAALAASEPLGGTTAVDRAAAKELAARAEFDRPVPDGTPYQATISELLLWSACPRCHWTRYHLGVDENPVLRPAPAPAPDPDGETEPPDRPGLDELPPTDRGIAVHEVLSVWDTRSGLAAKEAAKIRLSGWMPEISDETVDVVAELADSFYTSWIGREVLDADPRRVRREVPFLVRWRTGRDLADLLLRGQIDLLYPRPDGTLHIVDYKTGLANEKYEIQLLAYARAVREFAACEVEASLVYLRPGTGPEVRTVPVGGDRMAAIEGEADAFAAYLRDGGPVPLEHLPGCRATR
ncbi:MAG: UvrD-helicase domain-containing protein [Planctomycetota bacterium]